MAGKRDPMDIIQAIFSDLEKDGLKTITEISKNIRSGYHTVKNYLDIIQFVNSKPRIQVDKTKNMTVVKLVKDGGSNNND